MQFDTGCYYLTVLASLLGPAKQVSAFSRRHHPERVGERTDRPWFGETITVEADNIMTAVAEYANGVICSIHFNSESILDEMPRLEIYGSEGILEIGDPNQFGSPVYLRKSCSERTVFPFTHGYLEDSRGLGAAEMAWSIRADRNHRVSKEMAFHVFEMIHGMYISASGHQIYQIQSSFEKPHLLPNGYIDNGFWGPTQESALI